MCPKRFKSRKYVHKKVQIKQAVFLQKSITCSKAVFLAQGCKMCRKLGSGSHEFPANWAHEPVRVGKVDPFAPAPEDCGAPFVTIILVISVPRRSIRLVLVLTPCILCKVWILITACTSHTIQKCPNKGVPTILNARSKRTLQQLQQHRLSSPVLK